MVRYAESDQDIILIHRFLCFVAGPNLLAPIDAEKSMAEVERVAKYEAALMATKNDILVGTMGIVQAGDFWYAKQGFLTNRWFFVHPVLRNEGIGEALCVEAQEIAKNLGMPLIIYKERKRRSINLCIGELMAQAKEGLN